MGPICLSGPPELGSRSHGREIALATQLFAEEELDRLRGFSEIGCDELSGSTTLAPADVD